MPTAKKTLRPRGQLGWLVALVMLGVATLGTAAAQIIPVTKPPSHAEQMADEIAGIQDQRKIRLAILRATGDRCQPQTAHELVKLLVFHGLWDDAQIYAHDYEARCGTDPVVHAWGNAPRPRPRPGR